MTDNSGPLEESWALGDVLTISAFATGWVFGLAFLLIVDGGAFAKALVASNAALICGYESGLIPHYKHEVSRRL